MPEELGFLAPIVRRLAQQGDQGNFRSLEHRESYLKLLEILEEKGADFDLEQKIVSRDSIDGVRMDRELLRPILEEGARLRQKRRELYERLQQERREQEEE
jgi:hypothetical protein